MKILYLIHTYYPSSGGCEIKIKDLAEGLVSSGEEVTVFTSNAPTTYAFVDSSIALLPEGEEVLNGVKIRRFPVNRRFNGILKNLSVLSYKNNLPFNDIARVLYSGPFCPSMVQAINRQDFDILVASAFPFLTVYYPYVVRKLRKFPFCIVPCIHSEDKWSFERKIMKKVLSASDAVFIHTEYEKKYLTENGITKNKIFMSGCSVDPEKFRGYDGSDIRKKYGIENSTVIGFVGRQERFKGIDVLIHAMKKIWSGKPDTYLIIAGASTMYTKEIDLMIGSLKNSEREKIIMLNDFPDSDKPKIYAACDIICLPSKIESFGIAFLEAWACSKPVIGCRSGGVPYVVDDNVNGILTDYGNDGELASAVKELIENRQKRINLGANGRAKLYSNYTMDKIVNMTRQMYYNICGKQ